LNGTTSEPKTVIAQISRLFVKAGRTARKPSSSCIMVISLRRTWRPPLDSVGVCFVCEPWSGRRYLLGAATSPGCCRLADSRSRPAMVGRPIQRRHRGIPPLLRNQDTQACSTTTLRHAAPTHQATDRQRPGLTLSALPSSPPPYYRRMARETSHWE